jgi:hypothetical protein
MNGSQIPSWAGFLFGGKPRPGGPERNGPPAVGPPHIARRHFSRRQFLRTAASAAGVVLGSGWLLSPEALAARGDPRPLPGGTHLPFVPEVPIFHFYQPGPLNEVSTITDFNGLIAQARLIGTGTGTDTDTGEEKDLNFEADIRFMKGEYVDVDGRRRHGAFAFL